MVIFWLVGVSLYFHMRKKEEGHRERKSERKKERKSGNSLVVHWLGLQVFSAEGLGSIPGWRTRIPQARGHWLKKRVSQSCKRALSPASSFFKKIYFMYLFGYIGS